MKHGGAVTAPPILIYQMGKVGSTSLWETLTRSGIPNPVYKVHYLSDHGIREGGAVFTHLLGVPGTLPHSDAVREVRELLTDEPDRPWKVVSVVRDPIARDVSSFVQLVHFAHPELTRPTIQEDKIARAASLQFAMYSESDSYHSRWFDTEIRDMFGIDVFETPFDHEHRRLRVSRGNVDLMVLRLEDLTATLSGNLSWFLGVPPSDIPAVYASSRHPEKQAPAYDPDVYRRIVKRVRVPLARSRPIYESRFARHFYTDDEIGRFAAGWAEGRD
ncbi:putative capsular polysaccharide synthesis family protein [Micromonospora sp. NPDC002296]|uniref:putative capsular polysaccharide synthesis family protein n=1 Tax=Micromonospora sp. NPDC002296 TaxID=3154271 RepID=UPI00332AAA7F